MTYTIRTSLFVRHVFLAGLAASSLCARPVRGEAEPARESVSAHVDGPCFARFVPERMDDFAWENDRIGFRVFGPALSLVEETGNGVDVWV